MEAQRSSVAGRRCRSTPDLVALAAPNTSPGSSSCAPDEDVVERNHPLRAVIVGAEMRMESREQAMVVFFEISVVVSGQALCATKRRYREFLRLQRVLQARYPSLLQADEWGEQAELPPFPGKTLFRPAWSPEVVTERVKGLGLWLAAVCQKLQYASPELISFLNVPMYCAIRMLSGDLQPADLLEPCSPDTVIDHSERQASRDEVSPFPGPISPHVDQRSLPALANSLTNTVSRPGYNESALLVARAACSYSAAAGTPAPTLDEASRFVRAVCGRALFKPCSLIAAVVYLDRLGRSGALSRMLRAEGWQLVTLVVLVVSAKVWDSDYPISNADVCSPGSLPPAPFGSRPISMRRVNACERAILSSLDYCTLVTPAEFARCYLSQPFLFPGVPSRLTLDADKPTSASRKVGGSHTHTPARWDQAGFAASAGELPPCGGAREGAVEYARGGAMRSEKPLAIGGADCNPLCNPHVSMSAHVNPHVPRCDSLP